MTNKRHTVLYTGVTGDIHRRVWEHKEGLCTGFTKKYNCTELVLVETFDDPTFGIEREKEIKGWRRQKKIDLIQKSNPGWHDLYDSL